MKLMRLQIVGYSLLLLLSLSSSPSKAQPVSQAAAAASSDQSSIRDWFSKYDQIRRQAQMNPAERKKSDEMMSKGLSVIMPGEEKGAMQQFLARLVQKNKAAAEQLKGMPLYPETEKLHRGYYKYFNDASGLFADYIKVQGNLFVTDNSGRPIAGGLPVRKQALEALDQSNKELDAQLRAKFNIPPYQY